MNDKQRENLEQMEKKESTDRLSSKRLVFYFLTIIAIVVIIFFLFQKFRQENLVEDVAIEKSTKIFENLELEAGAVFVWDIREQKEIYSRNPEAQLPLASLTKVMMAITALDAMPDGGVITISGSDLKEEGDNGLFSGERWILRDLIDFSLIVSSNDGASAIASAIGSQISKENPENEFIRLMNKKAEEVGLAQTYFISPSGLDKKDVIPGGNGSARDVVRLFEYALKEFPDSLEATSYLDINFSSINNFRHNALNTNDLVGKLPGIIASKTGFTDLAGGNLVIVFEPEIGRPIVLVALGSSIDGRFEDIQKLYLTTLDYIN